MNIISTTSLLYTRIIMKTSQYHTSWQIQLQVLSHLHNDIWLLSHNKKARTITIFTD